MALTPEVSPMVPVPLTSVVPSAKLGSRGAHIWLPSSLPFCIAFGPGFVAVSWCLVFTASRSPLYRPDLRPARARPASRKHPLLLLPCLLLLLPSTTSTSSILVGRQHHLGACSNNPFTRGFLPYLQVISLLLYPSTVESSVLSAVGRYAILFQWRHLRRLARACGFPPRAN